MTGSGLRLGLVLALFSFVGFESATTLGAEARNPLKTIPRAVIQSPRSSAERFSRSPRTRKCWASTWPARIWERARRPCTCSQTSAAFRVLGMLIDIGALVSMFAGTSRASRRRRAYCCSWRTTGSRMAHCARRMRATRRPVTPSSSPESPRCCRSLVLADRGSSGLDVYGWMGSLATYGFIVTYALVCVALPRYLRRSRMLTLPARKYIPGSQASRCCSRWSETSIRCPKGLTESCRTSISCISRWTALVLHKGRGKNAPQEKSRLALLTSGCATSSKTQNTLHLPPLPVEISHRNN